MVGLNSGHETLPYMSASQATHCSTRIGCFDHEPEIKARIAQALLPLDGEHSADAPSGADYERGVHQSPDRASGGTSTADITPRSCKHH
jgi:hypothetical protein